MKMKTAQPTSNPELWNLIWDDSVDNHDQEFWEWVNRESDGVRGNKIQKYVQVNCTSFNGLRTIEVGSGPGIYSYIFAKLGADVTLLDYSEKALHLAKERFSAHGIPANYVFQDALKLDESLYGQYDLAMSFGTVEHFVYPERLNMIEAHLKLIRSGGSIAVSVPNQAFFLHEFLKSYLQKRGKWRLGYEGAFSRKEIYQVARQLHLKDPKVVGSAFLTDLKKYLHIYRCTAAAQQVLGPIQSTPILKERSSILDDYYGADLVLLGIKP